jgi:hypothetical protein
MDMRAHVVGRLGDGCQFAHFLLLPAGRDFYQMVKRRVAACGAAVTEIAGERPSMYQMVKSYANAPGGLIKSSSAAGL